MLVRMTKILNYSKKVIKMENVKILKNDSEIEIVVKDSFMINNLEMIEKEINVVLKKDFSKLKFNLEKINSIDIAALQYILVLKKNIQNNNKKFDFQCTLNSNLESILEKSGLLSLIEIKN